METEEPANLRNAQYHGNLKKTSGGTGLNQGKIFYVEVDGYAERKTLFDVPRDPYKMEKVGAGIKETQL
jgi:hypothetical protein